MIDDVKFLFKLQGFILRKIKIEKKRVILEVDRPWRNRRCPRCGLVSNNIHSRSPARLVKHQFFEDRIVYLSFRKRRFFCQNCDLPFSEIIKSIKPWQRQTDYFAKRCLISLRDRSFKAVSKDRKVGYSKLRKILTKVITPHLGKWPKDDNLIIGIDSHSYRGQDLVTTICDLKKKRLISVLRDDYQATLEEFLDSAPKNKVKEVCLDMDKGIKAAVARRLPEAKIVVDPFHVIQDANRRIDYWRLVLQEISNPKTRLPKRLFMKNREDLDEEEKIKLKSFFKNFRELKRLWRYKEKLRTFYRFEDKKKAQDYFEKVITSMEKNWQEETNEWSETLRRWQEYILNHFDSQTTNAYTEGVNVKFKLTKRISYGFRNVDVYIRKAMLCLLPLSFLLHHHTF